MRRYTDAGKLGEVMERKPQEVEQVLTSVPGFMTYHAILPGTFTLFPRENLK